MKKILIAILLVIILIISWIFYLNSSHQDSEIMYQNDADLIRLEHLEYWTWLVEEYFIKTWEYPFQNSLESNENIGLIRIWTKNQQDYFIKGSSKYNPNFDNNWNNFFQEFMVKDFVLELESKLGRNIEEKYDIQKVPTTSPIWYNYFVAEKGYLLWWTCITCWVTPISTLLMDWSTPTVNIVSEWMKEEVFKSLTRDEMLTHPIYKEWKNKKFNKEDYMRLLEKENINDSKS